MKYRKIIKFLKYNLYVNKYKTYCFNILSFNKEREECIFLGLAYLLSYKIFWKLCETALIDHSLAEVIREASCIENQTSSQELEKFYLIQFVFSKCLPSKEDLLLKQSKQRCVQFSMMSKVHCLEDRYSMNLQPWQTKQHPKVTIKPIQFQSNREMS